MVSHYKTTTICHSVCYFVFLAPSHCEQLLGSHALTSLAHQMETFSSRVTLQVSAISALAVGLGCWPQGRLRLLDEHGRLLDLVLMAMKNFPDHVQLQEYACSFMALLMAEGMWGGGGMEGGREGEGEIYICAAL